MNNYIGRHAYHNIFLGNRAGVGEAELLPSLYVVLRKNRKKRLVYVSIVDVARCDHAIRFTGMVLQPRCVRTFLIVII
jgi:hypothetical protein